MFVKNNIQQLSIDDPLHTMPQYLRDILEKSWAHPFQKYIFPHINEERFSVLYSNNMATRPNSPVNIIIGLLMLKELFQLSDEELIGSLYFDIRFQYALRTTSYDKQPVSINTLTNFRTRLVEYEEQTGIDLLKEEVEDQAELITTYLNIDGGKARMDSLMVSTSAKKLTRLELVYNVNARMVKALNKINATLLPEDCKAYLEKGHKNETIYRTRDTETESKLTHLLKQSMILYDIATQAEEKIRQTEEYQLLSRMIKEQLKADESGTLIPKEGKEISPVSLQNPTDPDATYRKKNKESHVGYVLNVLETYNGENSVITTYDYKPNVYSDSKFADDVIHDLANRTKEQTDTLQIIVDGAYYEQNKAEEALSQGIELIPTELVGRKPTEGKISITSFVMDQEKNKVIACPNGKKPEGSYFNANTYTAKFRKEDCEVCPHQANCPIKQQKKYNTIRFSKKQYQTTLQRERMQTEEYIKLANERAGVEGIPSVFRRKYHIDSIPVRGLLRSKIWVGFKIAASNIKKLLKQASKPRKSPTPDFPLALNHKIYCIFSFHFLRKEPPYKFLRENYGLIVG